MEAKKISGLVGTVTNVKSTAPTGGIAVRGFSIDNVANGSGAYLKFFDKPAASVILGTTAPVFTWYYPANTAQLEPYQLQKLICQGVTGLSVVAVTGKDDSSTTAASAIDVIVFMD